MSKPEEKGNLFSRIKSALLFGGETEQSAKQSKQESAEQTGHLDEMFATGFSQAGGKFAYCITEDELVDELQLIFQDSGWKHIFCVDKELGRLLSKAGIPSKDLLGLEECQATLTHCEALLADSGKLVMSARVDKSRQLRACPPIQLVVAYVDQLCANESAAMAKLDKKYGDQKPASVTLLSPPEKSKDLDKTLINQGANEPKELFVFLLESRNA